MLEIGRNHSKLGENHTDRIDDIASQQKDKHEFHQNGVKNSGKALLKVYPSNIPHCMERNSKQLSTMSKANDDEKRCSIVTEL